MNSGRVAIRYAKGLLKLGNEKEISSMLYTDALTLINIFRDSESLANLMISPSVTADQKLNIIKDSFSGSVHPLILDYLSMIIRKGRSVHTLNSLLLFRDLYRKENNILEVQVESATVLSETELTGIDNFIKKMFNKSTELLVLTNPDLIAGFILIVEGKILDYSVKGQLSQYKKSLGLSFSN